MSEAPTSEVAAAEVARTVFERAGGMPFFEALVARFYGSVADDPLLRPLYPDADLAPAQRRLTLFLAQYWGGPTTYDQERGHPRLRMRHAPFAIGTRRARSLAAAHARLDRRVRRGRGRAHPPPRLRDDGRRGDAQPALGSGGGTMEAAPP